MIIPAATSATCPRSERGFLMMYDLGLIKKLPRIVCAQAQNANPLYLSFLKGFSEFVPVRAKKTLANAIQIGNP